MRLFTALGPGDLVRARQMQLAGNAINETSIAFSAQLLAYCRIRNITTLAISSNSRTDEFDEGLIRVENRGKLLKGRGGAAFHLSWILYGLYLAVRARRFRADIALIDSGSTHYFVLIVLRTLGIPVVVNLHNVLWPPGFPPSGPVSRCIRYLNAIFFRYFAAGAIGVSPECERQILSESRNRVPFAQYRCQFSRTGFDHLARTASDVFRIAFVGRIEENKGVLDIPSIAKSLRRKGEIKVIFEVCGEGPALAQLSHVVHEEQLDGCVIIHGRLERAELLNVYARSDAVIVPTRSNFTEGMPQVSAEAILAGVPVIASDVTNTFDVIGPATIQVATDDVEGYADAVSQLAKDQSLRNRLTLACAEYAPQFLDRAQSYPAAVDRVLEAIQGQAPLQQYVEIFKELDQPGHELDHGSSPKLAIGDRETAVEHPASGR